MPPCPTGFRLGLDRIAFYRAWMEGTLPLVDIARRYLETGDNVPAAKRTLKEIEKQFVLACLRLGRPADARLIRLDLARLRARANEATAGAASSSGESSIPTFDEYYEKYSDHWGYEQLLEQYNAEYGDQAEASDSKARKQAKRAQNLISRRNSLIMQLQEALCETPSGKHDVRGWLDESLSKHLWEVGLRTLDDVVQYANEKGYYWYRSIPGLGATKAARVVDFLQRHSQGLKTPLSAYATTMPREFQRAAARHQVALLDAPSYALASAQRFGPVRDGLYVPPEQLDGSQGKNRAPLSKNRSGAQNDFEAIQLWLNTFNEPHQRHTQRNYRKEAERLLFWAVYQKGIAFSDMTTQDVIEFRAFLSDPTPHELWVGTRTYPRQHPNWRPFIWRKPPRSERALPGRSDYREDSLQAGLSDASIRQSICVCRALCSWLVQQRYLDYNPFSGMSKKRQGIAMDTTRSLTRRQWQFAMRVLEQMDQSQLKTKRLNFVLRLAYSTGLRLSEMINEATTDKIYVEEDVRGTYPDAYFLKVLGKGDVERSVPLTRSVRKALSDYLVARGLSSDPRQCPSGTPLIAKLYETRQGWGMTPQALYEVLAGFFRQVAEQLPKDENYDADYRRFYQASTHWLRHTYGTHALAYGADLNVVRGNLGHTSLATTSLYTRAEKRLQVEQMEAFDEAANASD